MKRKLFRSFFASEVGFSLYPEIFYEYIITKYIILPHFRIIVGDDGFEPGTQPQPQKSDALYR